MRRWVLWIGGLALVAMIVAGIWPGTPTMLGRVLFVIGPWVAVLAASLWAALLAIERRAWRPAMLLAIVAGWAGLAVGVVKVLGPSVGWDRSSGPSPQATPLVNSPGGFTLYGPSWFDVMCLLGTVAVALPWAALVSSARAKRGWAPPIRVVTVASVALLSLVPPTGIALDMTRRLDIGSGVSLLLAAILLGALAVAGSLVLVGLSRGRSPDSCPACGHTVLATSVRCPECGAEVAAPNAAFGKE